MREIRQKKLLIGGIIIFLAIGALGFTAFRGAATYYYTVSELKGQESAVYNHNVRVAGQVATGSVQHLQSGANEIRFSLLDSEKPDYNITVAYKGAIPDAFKEGSEAVVEGKLSPSGLFEARQIIVKCPSKYEPLN